MFLLNVFVAVVFVLVILAIVVCLFPDCEHIGCIPLQLMMVTGDYGCAVLCCAIALVYCFWFGLT